MDCPLFLSNTKRKTNKKSLKSCHSRRHLRNRISPVFLFNGQLLISSFLLFCSINVFYHFFLLLSVGKSSVFLLFIVICRFLLFQNLKFELPREKKRNIIFLCFLSNLCYCRDNFSHSVLSCECLVPEVVQPYHEFTLL